MVGMFGGVPISGPRGEKGPDGNPIGTVISFMGVKAPKDYLICDGSVYNISDYPDLSSFFKDQFGTASYFGGNGTTTFAVPDMRNLFLRGYRGSAQEKLSGNIGVKQEATEHSNVYGAVGSSNDLHCYVLYSEKAGVSNMPTNYDKKTVSRRLADMSIAAEWTDSTYSPRMYTSRPVNMAVLYCIKVN